jgi:hypothetical protein
MRFAVYSASSMNVPASFLSILFCLTIENLGGITNDSSRFSVIHLKKMIFANNLVDSNGPVFWAPTFAKNL